MEPREYLLEYVSGKIVIDENGQGRVEFTTSDHNEEPRIFMANLTELVPVVEA